MGPKSAILCLVIRSPFGLLAGLGYGQFPPSDTANHKPARGYAGAPHRDQRSSSSPPVWSGAQVGHSLSLRPVAKAPMLMFAVLVIGKLVYFPAGLHMVAKFDRVDSI
jgi:hypothetical protein